LTDSSRATTPDAAGWLADLKCQEQQAARAAFLLEHAVETLREEQPDEDRGVKAQRLRGAAVVAQTAALELMATCGWLECAQAVEMRGLLPEVEVEHYDGRSPK
jgi:hypothetical protein